MNADWIGTLFSAWTVVAAVIFAGITAWAYSGARRAEFEEAARLPLDDSDEEGAGGQRHG